MPIYEKLFNIILDHSTVPSDWTKSNNISIFKNKVIKTIQLIPPYNNIKLHGQNFDIRFNNRLSKYLEDNDILNETQSGYRKEYSTTDNIMALYGLLESVKSRKISCIAASSILL